MDLEVGKTYRIWFNDCCCEGEFVAKVEKIDTENDRVDFEGGAWIGQLWGQWKFTEVS